MTKKYFLLTGLILAVTIIRPQIVKAQTSEFINFILPQQTTTVNPRQLVEGTIEQKSIKHLHLRIEPFIKRKNIFATQSVITVRDGYFREETTLYPGLNLIYIETRSKNIYAVKPIFLIAQEKKDDEPSIDTWGRQSKIVFTQPAALRLNETNTKVKGVLTDPEVKTLVIISMNAVDFLDTSGEIQGGKREHIHYQEVPVKDRQFDCQIHLTEGLNIILAKPLGQPVGFEDIQVKSVLYERTNGNIVLSDAVFDKATGEIAITGAVNDPNIKSVDIEVKALACEVNNPFKVFPLLILTEKAGIDKNGNFAIRKSLKENKYIIKSPPTITVKAKGNVATKTLLKWQ